jgi:hypothetical protein
MPLHITDNLQNLTSLSAARSNLKVPGSDATAISGANNISNIITITPNAYANLTLRDPNTIYIVVEL